MPLTIEDMNVGWQHKTHFSSPALRGSSIKEKQNPLQVLNHADHGSTLIRP